MKCWFLADAGRAWRAWTQTCVFQRRSQVTLLTLLRRRAQKYCRKCVCAWKDHYFASRRKRRHDSLLLLILRRRAGRWKSLVFCTWRVTLAQVAFYVKCVETRMRSVVIFWAAHASFSSAIRGILGNVLRRTLGQGTFHAWRHRHAAKRSQEAGALQILSLWAKRAHEYRVRRQLIAWFQSRVSQAHARRSLRLWRLVASRMIHRTIIVGREQLRYTIKMIRAFWSALQRHTRHSGRRCSSNQRPARRMHAM